MKGNGLRNDVMRFTVIDDAGGVSFIAPCRTLDALVAACAAGPLTLEALLDAASRFEPELRDRVQSGLAVFDEHNTAEDFSRIRACLDGVRADETPPFRVVDEATRRWSLEPTRLGLVVFNLPARRIVQVQNSYGELARRGLGRVRQDGKPTGRLYRYELPAEWAILP